MHQIYKKSARHFVHSLAFLQLFFIDFDSALLWQTEIQKTGIRLRLWGTKTSGNQSNVL